jgi:translation initiation factor IF-2
LARELEVKSKAVLDALPLSGISEKKTHSSSLEEHEANRVRAYFQLKQLSSSQRVGSTRAKGDIKTKIDLSRVSRPGDVLKKIAQYKKTPLVSLPQSPISSASQPSWRPVRGQPIYRRPALGRASATIRPVASGKRTTQTAAPPSPRVIMPQTGPRPVYRVSQSQHSVERETLAATSAQKIDDRGTIDQAEEALKILRAQEKQRRRERDPED